MQYVDTQPFDWLFAFPSMASIPSNHININCWEISLLDLDFQYEYRPRKRGLSILLSLKASSKRCQKSYHRDNWLVAAKRP